MKQLGVAMAAGAMLAVGASLLTMSHRHGAASEAGQPNANCRSYEEQKSKYCRDFASRAADAGTEESK